MTILMTEPQSVMLISVYKPIIMFIVFLGWAKIVARFDKDLQALFLSRTIGNGIQLACGAIALIIWLIGRFARRRLSGE